MHALFLHYSLFDFGSSYLHLDFPGMHAGLPKYVPVNLKDIEAAGFQEGDEVSLESLKAKGLINPSGRERKLPLKVCAWCSSIVFIYQLFVRMVTRYRFISIKGKIFLPEVCWLSCGVLSYRRRRVVLLLSDLGGRGVLLEAEHKSPGLLGGGKGEARGRGLLADRPSGPEEVGEALRRQEPRPCRRVLRQEESGGGIGIGCGVSRFCRVAFLISAFRSRKEDEQKKKGEKI